MIEKQTRTAPETMFRDESSRLPHKMIKPCATRNNNQVMLYDLVRDQRTGKMSTIEEAPMAV